MNVETDKVQTDKAGRRRRKTPPRRLPAIIEERERRPFLFGWGSELNHRERESLKERIALFGGIVLAAALLLILGWGWYQDNIAAPAAVRAANNRPVAQVGNVTITVGAFKKYETLQNYQLNNNLTTIQQEISTLQAQKNGAKKNAAQIASLESQQSSIQQQLGSLASGSLTALIDDEAVLQRSATAGEPLTPKVENAAWLQVVKQAGGALHVQQSLQQESPGMTVADLRPLVTADYLKQKIAAKLAAGVSTYQTEVRARHILIATKNKALAEKLYKELRADHGANFAALAKKYSTDPGSAKKGGDLGYFPHGTMVAPFDKAAFSMQVGEIRLVQSQYGWHIIQVTGRKRAKLTSTQLAQAQQGAYTGWLTKQEDLLHVQRFLAPAQLPAVSPTATPIGL